MASANAVGPGDGPAEVAEVVGVAGMDGDPVGGVVDPQPNRPVGARRGELEAEDLRTELGPGVGLGEVKPM